MYRLASMMVTVALLLSADSSGLLVTPPSSRLVTFPAGETLPALQGTPPSADQGRPAPAASPDKSEKPDKSDPSTNTKPVGSLQPASRLSLVRYVDGEIVQVVRPIPSGKKGLHIKAGAAPNENTLSIASSSAGPSINPGDRAQITDLDFKEKQIIIDINGGGKGKTRLRDRIHLEVGGAPSMSTTPDTPVKTTEGATIYLDFDKPLPDMTAEDLEKMLSSVLDFSKRHSAAIQWVETLPPEIQKAIQDKQPVVGMDHEMVLAAMGRPDRKVREKGDNGNEIEDWIYGNPPAKTIFVIFEGDKVTQVHQYPQ